MKRRIVTGIAAALCALCAASATAGTREGRILAMEESARAFALGVASQRRGDFDEAATHYRRAIELDASFVEAMTNLARVHVDRGEAKAADDLLARAAALRPDYARPHAVGGLAALRASDFHAAVQQLERAHALDPYDVETLVNLGAAWIGAGRPDRARAHLEQALRLDPTSAAASLNLAIAEEQSDRLAHAVFWYGRFLDLARRDGPTVEAVRERARTLSRAASAAEVAPEPGLGAKRRSTRHTNEGMDGP